MPKKQNITYEQAKTLFTLDKGKYVRKEDDIFVSAFMKIIQGTNKNDTPFTKNEIKTQKTWDEFSFVGKNDFEFVCYLKANAMVLNDTTNNWDNEKIKAHGFAKGKDKTFNDYIGVAYAITCLLNEKEYIIKFGSTRTTFKQRLGSYNCGVVNSIRTASTTNIKMLQSMVACNVDFKLYLYPCGEAEIIEWQNEKAGPFSSPKPLVVENIMLKKFTDQFMAKPLANIQTKISGKISI